MLGYTGQISGPLPASWMIAGGIGTAQGIERGDLLDHDELYNDTHYERVALHERSLTAILGLRFVATEHLAAGFELTAASSNTAGLMWGFHCVALFGHFSTANGSR